MVAGRFLSLQTPTEVAEDNNFKQKKLSKAELETSYHSRYVSKETPISDWSAKHTILRFDILYNFLQVHPLNFELLNLGIKLQGSAPRWHFCTFFHLLSAKFT